ncbi:Spo0E family sporulation regulatory protein-aspartic acid phosphatase [Clostridium sp. CF012]
MYYHRNCEVVSLSQELDKLIFQYYSCEIQI